MPPSWGTTGILIYDEPKRLDLFLDFAYYDQIDTLPGAQNVSTSFTRLVTGEARLKYTDVKRSIGAVDDEKGLEWSLNYMGNRVQGEITPQFYGDAGLRHRAALREHVSVAAGCRRGC